MEGSSGVHVHSFSFHIKTEGIIESWIFLDIQSTVNIFFNGSLLSNIIEADQCMNVCINAGVSGINLIGDF